MARPKSKQLRTALYLVTQEGASVRTAAKLTKLHRSTVAESLARDHPPDTCLCCGQRIPPKFEAN